MDQAWSISETNVRLRYCQGLFDWILSVVSAALLRKRSCAALLAIAADRHVSANGSRNADTSRSRPARHLQLQVLNLTGRALLPSMLCFVRFV